MNVEQLEYPNDSDTIIYNKYGLQVLICGNLLQISADKGVDLYTPKCSYKGLRNFLTNINDETVINLLLPNHVAISLYINRGTITLCKCFYDNENKTILGPDQYGVRCERPLNNRSIDIEELKNLLD